MGTSMTRDELIAKIKQEESRPYDVDATGWTALRAIVELHKPDEYDGKTCQAHEQCWGCGEWGGSDGCDCKEYPCQTIKAIEGAFHDL